MPVPLTLHRYFPAAVLSLAAIFCMAGEGVAQHRPAANASANDAAIAKLVADEAEAWNAGDAHAYAATFADDGAFVNIRGERFRGRTAFEQRHKAIFAGSFKGSHIQQKIDRLQWLSPESGYAEVAVELKGFKTLPPGVSAPPDGILRTHLLEVVKKTNGKWLVEAYYNIYEMPTGK